jgi:hypothetical protein
MNERLMRVRYRRYWAYTDTGSRGSRLENTNVESYMVIIVMEHHYLGWA